MSTLSERILLCLETPGKTQSGVARACGIKGSSVSAWISGKTKKIEGANLLRAADYFGVNPEWLATGRGPMRQTMAAAISAHDDHVESDSESLHRSGRVPLISWVAAGHWAEVVDPYAVGDAEDWLPCPRRHGSRTYALRVEGLSMHNPRGKPSFSEGDIIFVDPDLDATHGSLVVVRLEDEKKATFKRLLIDGDRRYLEALNPDWPERIFPINGNAMLCGVVIGRFEPF